MVVACRLEYELERGNTGDDGFVAAESTADEKDDSEGDLVRGAASIVDGGTR